LHKPDATTR